jgi:hypothetical protein
MAGIVEFRTTKFEWRIKDEGRNSKQNPAGTEVIVSAAYAATKVIFTAETPRRRELSDNSSELAIQSDVLKSARSTEFHPMFRSLSAPRRLCGESILQAK